MKSRAVCSIVPSTTPSLRAAASFQSVSHSPRPHSLQRHGAFRVLGLGTRRRFTSPAAVQNHGPSPFFYSFTHPPPPKESSSLRVRTPEEMENLPRNLTGVDPEKADGLFVGRCCFHCQMSYRMGSRGTECSYHGILNVFCIAGSVVGAKARRGMKFLFITSTIQLVFFCHKNLFLLEITCHGPN